MAKALSMTMNIPGVEVWVNYNAGNKKVTTVQWTLPQSGVVAHVRPWNAGTLFYNRTITGPASGTETVPGSHTVVLVNDGIYPPFYALPAYITWSINVEAIGG